MEVQHSAPAQFTVPKDSLENLQEWEERLQKRFRVKIDIQWELDGDVLRSADDESLQIRWVTLKGSTQDCKDAKNYICTLCDPKHKMLVTYPEKLHTKLQESHENLEDKYSSVIQFFEVGKMLIKTNDDTNLLMVLSVVESLDVNFSENSEKLSSVALHEYRSLKNISNLIPNDEYTSMEADSELFELLENSTHTTHLQPSHIIAASSSSALPRQLNHRELSTRSPQFLKGKEEILLPDRQMDLLRFPPPENVVSVSPGRKRIKPESLSTDDETKSSQYGGFPLNPQQRLTVQRIVQQGNFTDSEIKRLLEKLGNRWYYSDLPALLTGERRLRYVPQTTTTFPENEPLSELKNTQEMLMKSLGNLQTSPSRSQANRGGTSITGNVMHGNKRSPMIPKGPTFRGCYHSENNLEDRAVGAGSYTSDTDSIIILSESEDRMDSVIHISDSSDESDTHEVFYINGVPERKQGPSKPRQQTPDKAWQSSRPSSEDKQRTEELHGIVECLSKQLKELQDKMEREKQESSDQKIAATMLQQTQQEEMERQNKQQQERLLEQQQHFQEQFEQQEKKLKADQEMAFKQLQQQQTALPDIPRDAIILKPPRKDIQSELRPIVIDGSNVAMSHGRGVIFSCRGIAICIEYFQKRGHTDIIVFVPQGRRTQNPNLFDRQMKDQGILEILEKQGLLSFTPSRRIGNTYVNCYDDRFIVELAVENDGAIVSNDNYRDLMGESSRWKFVIENRLVMYTFAGDVFMIPADPLGRTGPRISQVLRKDPSKFANRNKYQRASRAGVVASVPPHPPIALVGADIPKTHNKKKAAPTFVPNQGASVRQDARELAMKSSMFKTLAVVFPNNKEEVVRVLMKHGSTNKGIDILSFLILEEIERSSKSR